MPSLYVKKFRDDVERQNTHTTDVAISVKNLSKCYLIYNRPEDRLKQSVFPRLQRFFGLTPKQYHQEFWALKDVTFTIKKGETIGIIGRNGSGKSTILQIICGMLSPTTGNVMTNGRIAALLELGSGFNPEFTGRENVYLNGAVLGFSKEEIDSRFDDISAFADIGQFIEQPIKTYSSGMLVRLAFAVNVMVDPEIMIVDEALSVGDMNFQAKCMTALTRIQENGTTILFVSHDISSVKSLCSRGIYLENGKVIDVGPASDVAGHYVRTMREEMNEEHNKSDWVTDTYSDLTQSNPIQLVNSSESVFKTSEKFDARVETFRYGSGKARITYSELLDKNGIGLVDVSFDQVVLIKIYWISHANITVSPNYYIQDEKKILVLGAGPRQLDVPLIKAKDKDRFVVTYKTRLPLREGVYSIQIQLTEPVVPNAAAKFLDVIDDAIVFRVHRRSNARIWSQVFIPNSIKIELL